MSQPPKTGLPIVAIALGDPAGIGPEVALKAAQDPAVRAVCIPLLVGDRRALEAHAAACGLAAPLHVVARAADAATVPADQIALLHLDLLGNEKLALGTISALHGHAAVGAARAAIAAAMAGEAAAVVACPQTEMAIHLAGIPFDGYPSFVARCTDTPEADTFLMLCFDDKRITHTTLHVSLRQAIDLITPARVVRALEATIAMLRHGGIAKPRIAVSGLNPHASEGGLFGSEEAEIIVPAMAQVSQSHDVVLEGPFGADTMFQKPGYDAFVVMFHDQGHLAAKLLATNRTAGLAIGTPILFSSVAHGSALDIAGQNQARPAAVVEAVLRLVGTPTPGIRAAA